MITKHFIGTESDNLSEEGRCLRDRSKTLQAVEDIAVETTRKVILRLWNEINQANWNDKQKIMNKVAKIVRHEASVITASYGWRKK